MTLPKPSRKVWLLRVKAKALQWLRGSAQLTFCHPRLVCPRHAGIPSVHWAHHAHVCPSVFPLAIPLSQSLHGQPPHLPLFSQWRLLWSTYLKLQPTALPLAQHSDCPPALECNYTWLYVSVGFPGGSAVKNPPAVLESQEIQVWFLGQEDPLKEGMATHSSILAWIIPWTEEAGGLQSIESQRVRHDWATVTHTWVWSPWGQGNNNRFNHICLEQCLEQRRSSVNTCEMSRQLSPDLSHVTHWDKSSS